MTKQQPAIESVPVDELEEVTELDEVTGGRQRAAGGHPQMAQQAASSCSCHEPAQSIFTRYGIRTEKGPTTGEK